MSALTIVDHQALPESGAATTDSPLSVDSTIVIKRKIPGSAIEALFLAKVTGFARRRVTGVVTGIVCTRATAWKAGKAKQAGLLNGSGISAKPCDTGVVVGGRIQWLGDEELP